VESENETAEARHADRLQGIIKDMIRAETTSKFASLAQELVVTEFSAALGLLSKTKMPMDLQAARNSSPLLNTLYGIYEHFNAESRRGDPMSDRINECIKKSNILLRAHHHVILFAADNINAQHKTITGLLYWLHTYFSGPNRPPVSSAVHSLPDIQDVTEWEIALKGCENGDLPRVKKNYSREKVQQIKHAIHARRLDYLDQESLKAALTPPQNFGLGNQGFNYQHNNNTPNNIRQQQNPNGYGQSQFPVFGGGQAGR